MGRIGFSAFDLLQQGNRCPRKGSDSWARWPASRACKLLVTGFRPGGKCLSVLLLGGFDGADSDLMARSATNGHPAAPRACRGSPGL